MAWRKAGAGLAAGAVAALEGFEAELQGAAARGDEWAAGRLPSVRSWLGMLAHAGGDAGVGDLFAEFARCDREIWERRRGVA